MFDYAKQKQKQDKKKEDDFSANKHVMPLYLRSTPDAPSGEVVQRQPEPVEEDFDGTGDEYKDSEHPDIKFVKLKNDIYLYDERVLLRWNNPNYKDKDGNNIDITTLEAGADKALIVGMGEEGEIPKAGGAFSSMMTSEASPCLILIIESAAKIRMSHIFCGNKDDEVERLKNSVVAGDKVTLATQVDPNEAGIIAGTYTEGITPEVKQEYTKQKQRRDQLNEYFSAKEGITYTYNAGMKNATVASSGTVTAHESGTEPRDVSSVSSARSMKTQSRFQASGAQDIKKRTSNVTDNDNYDHLVTSDSGAVVVQLQKKVYKGRTRAPEDGFDEEAMYEVFKRSALANSLEDEAGELGFSYVGDTGSGSNANTDIDKKEIRIRKDRTVEEAAHAFAYELTNARNGGRITDVHKMLGKPVDERTDEQAGEYAGKILNIEAEAVFSRTMAAIESGTADKLSNQKYVGIVTDKSLDYAQKIDAIYKKMLSEGTIGKDKIPAVDYYKNQYMTWNSGD